jgi:hypothetical protein
MFNKTHYIRSLFSGLSVPATGFNTSFIVRHNPNKVSATYEGPEALGWEMFSAPFVTCSVTNTNNAYGFPTMASGNYGWGGKDRVNEYNQISDVYMSGLFKNSTLTELHNYIQKFYNHLSVSNVHTRRYYTDGETYKVVSEFVNNNAFSLLDDIIEGKGNYVDSDGNRLAFVSITNNYDNDLARYGLALPNAKYKEFTILKEFKQAVSFIKNFKRFMKKGDERNAIMHESTFSKFLREEDLPYLINPNYREAVLKLLEKSVTDEKYENACKELMFQLILGGAIHNVASGAELIYSPSTFSYIRPNQTVNVEVFKGFYRTKRCFTGWV